MREKLLMLPVAFAIGFGLTACNDGASAPEAPRSRDIPSSVTVFRDSRHHVTCWLYQQGEKAGGLSCIPDKENPHNTAGGG